MNNFADCVAEYKHQLARGCIQEAYRGLMKYMAELRSYFSEHYPDYGVPGGLYPGYMDMTYFSIVPGSLRSRRLKVAVVFLHETIRFEVWLAGNNRQVQAEYCQLFKNSKLADYRLSSPGPGIDSILEYDLVIDPDFNAPDALTRQIERGTLKVISDVEEFLTNKG
jgi:hypothetical protein